MPGLKIGEHAAPEDRAGGRNVVALIRPACFRLGERVRERVVPFLEGKRNGLVTIRRTLERGEGRLELRQRSNEDAFRWCRVHDHTARAESMIEEDLHERATG